MRKPSNKYPKLSAEISAVKNILRKYNHLFEEDLSYADPDIRTQSSPHGRFFILYWPVKTGKGSIEGLTLKDNMGTVTIEIRYGTTDLRNFEESQHTFRYINSNHEYMITFENGVTYDETILNAYTFRFDKDLKPLNKRVEHPLHHIQVLHNVPRFVSTPEESSLERFLALVENSYFVSDDKALVGNNIPFFANSA